MGLLDKLWDDVIAGPQPDKGLGRLRRDSKSAPVPEEVLAARQRMMDRRQSGEFQNHQEETRRVTQSIAIAKPPLLRSLSFDPDASSSLPSTPTAGTSAPVSPASESPSVRERENVWRSVFHPGSNKQMKKLGSQKFDKAEPNSPTVYDWLYSGETKSSWR